MCDAKAAQGGTPNISESAQADWFDRVIKILGFISVIAGLLLTNFQLQANRETAQSGLWHQVSHKWLEMDKIIIDNPEIRRYLYSGVDLPPNHSDYHKMMATVTYVLDFVDYAIATATGYAKTEQLSSEWSAFGARIFRNSPAACREIFENRSMYSIATTKLADQHCNRTTPKSSSSP